MAWSLDVAILAAGADMCDYCSTFYDTSVAWCRASMSICFVDLKLLAAASMM